MIGHHDAAAVLFVEAARTLGFGARIVSGYMYDSGQAFTPARGAGSTHAWAEIYLPGAGWIVFGICIVFVVGVALPLISKRGANSTPPVPRKETLRDWRNEKK